MHAKQPAFACARTSLNELAFHIASLFINNYHQHYIACHVAPRRVPLVTTSLGLGVFARPAAAAAFNTSASIIDQVTFKEMGMLSWLIVDVAIQWGGWAVSALLKVRCKSLAHQQLHVDVQQLQDSVHISSPLVMLAARCQWIVSHVACSTSGPHLRSATRCCCSPALPNAAADREVL